MGLMFRLTRLTITMFKGGIIGEMDKIMGTYKVDTKFREDIRFMEGTNKFREDVRFMEGTQFSREGIQFREDIF